MAFTKITNTELNSRGATTLPNQPTISATALKQEFDAPAKNVVAPKVNNLIDELEATSAATSLGATAPPNRAASTTVQGALNNISGDLDTAISDIANLQVDSHTHSNKGVLDKLSDTGGKLYYDGSVAGTTDYNDLDNKPSINGNTLSGNKTSSDLGLMPATTLATVATSGSYNDLQNKPSIPTVTDTYSGTSSDAMSGKAVKSAIDNITFPVKDAYKVIDVTSGGSTTHITASSEDTIEFEAGANITLTATGKSVKIDATGGGGGGGSYTASKGVTISGSDIEADLKGYTAGSEAAAAYGSTANRTYAVGLDSNNKLAVNIPLSAAALSGSYADLSNKPQINGNTLSGNKTTSQLGISLAGLADASITTPTGGQILEYDDVANKWKNAENIKEFARYAGAKTFAQLDATLLVAANVDKFYLCTDGGTISSADAANWVLPAGAVIPPDSHIAVIEDPDNVGNYLFDDFGGYIDISGKADATDLDEYTALVTQANGKATFTNLDPSLGYDLYFYSPDSVVGNITVPQYTNINKTIAGGKMTLEYTISGGTDGTTQWALRVLK